MIPVAEVISAAGQVIKPSSFKYSKHSGSLVDLDVDVDVSGNGRKYILVAANKRRRVATGRSKLPGWDISPRLSAAAGYRTATQNAVAATGARP